MTRSLSLGELRDLEAALRAGYGPEQWPDRDDPQPTTEAAQIVRTWLDAVYQRKSRPGARYDAALAKLAVGLMVAGGVCGVGAARYALRYDGSEPVNVIEFLSLLVFTQIALLLCAGLAWVLRRVWSRSATLKAAGALPRLIVDWLEARVSPAGNKPASTLDLRAIYRPVVSWYVLFLLQVFGLVFNIAVLVTSLGLVTFTDLAFAWSTTLQVNADEAHAAARVLGKPFPELVPSVEVMQATRYYRLEARYAGGDRDRRAANMAATSAWWPFLAAALLCYGLLPRVILMLVSYTAYRMRLRRVPLHAFEIDRLVRGIQGRAQLQVRSDLAVAGAGTSGSVGMQKSRRSAFVPQSGEAGVAIVWRDAPWTDVLVREAVLRYRGVEPRAVVRSEGDFDGRQTAARLPPQGHIYVLVDAFETLQKALIRFLLGLRQQLAPDRLIVILPLHEHRGSLVAPSRGEERAYWRKATEQLGDPFLGAEIGEPAP